MLTIIVLIIPHHHPSSLLPKYIPYILFLTDHTDTQPLMFSEYASRYLSKSQRPVPLFNRESTGHSDYLEAVSGSEGTVTSESESDSIDSDSEASSGPSNPPRDMLVEPSKSQKKKVHRTGLSLWTHNSPQGPSQPQASPSLTRPTSQQNVTRDPESGKIIGGKYLDNIVAVVYLVSLAFTLSTAILISAAPRQSTAPIYPIFQHSVKPLLCYTVFAAVVSAVWLYCMRNHAKAVMQSLVFVVPTTLIGTSIYSLSMSTHYSVGPHGLAHAVLRLSALVPLALAAIWIAYLRRMKNVMGKAGELVAYSAEVYGECTPTISTITMVMGIFSIQATCLWAYFLSNAFLEGKLGYFLGVWFSFMYLWSWSLVCNLLKSVLVCVTNEWYAHGKLDAWSMDGIFTRGALEVATYHFSSACLSSLASVQIRVPLLVLPRYVLNVAHRYLISSNQMLDPLTLPTAILERCSLANAAKVLASSKFALLDRRAYRLSKMFLVAARLSCSICIGFVAWIHADHLQDMSSSYGYIIAIVALFIGWTVVGASENMLSMICDSLLVCFVINEQSPRREDVRHLFTKEAAFNPVESEYED